MRKKLSFILLFISCNTCTCIQGRKCLVQWQNETCTICFHGHTKKIRVVCADTSQCEPPCRCKQYCFMFYLNYRLLRQEKEVYHGIVMFGKLKIVALKSSHDIKHDATLQLLTHNIVLK